MQARSQGGRAWVHLHPAKIVNRFKFATVLAKTKNAPPTPFKHPGYAACF